MNNLANRLRLLSQEFVIPVGYAVIIIGLVYIYFVLRELKKDSKNRDDLLSKELTHIKELLSNHVTDTNKKIEKLEQGQARIEKEVRDKFEKILEILHKKTKSF